MHPKNCYCSTCLWDRLWKTQTIPRLLTIGAAGYVGYYYILPLIQPTWLTGIQAKNEAIVQSTNQNRRLLESFPKPLFSGATDQRRIGLGVNPEAAQLTFGKNGVYEIEYITNVYLSKRPGEINKVPVAIEYATIELLLMKNDVEVIHRTHVDVSARATPLHIKLVKDFQVGDRVRLFALTGNINGKTEENLEAEVVVDTYSFIARETDFPNSSQT